jgi:hypothetical protein
MTGTLDWTNSATSIWKSEEIFVTVKAYPHPSTKYIETVCVAGVTRDKQWIRLYPIPYRSLASEQQFPTYVWIKANIRKSAEHRPESHNIDIQTLEVQDRVGTADRWAARWMLLPTPDQSVEALKERQQTTNISLGMIRPKHVRKLLIQEEEHKWSPEELAKLRRSSLLDALQRDGTYQAAKELEKIPYRFLYDFICDDPRCHGHKLSVISWEIMQSYRKWSRRYGEGWEEKFRQRYERELLGAERDLHFFLGTISSHPQEWTIIGLYAPPASTLPPQKSIKQVGVEQLSLFETP